MNATPRTRPLCIAIAAMGGQGGGVLADWIVDIAEHADYFAQATSVPGVAQRTGATIYYIEIMPCAATGGRAPVMALMPVPGDVDIVIAGELAEAGRAVLRGLVTPDRTTLVASAHRDYALTEKMAMGDGRAEMDRLLEGVKAAACRHVVFDMNAVAENTGSVISSVLLGALAGSGALPFDRAQFEAAIRRSQVATEVNLAGFAAGMSHAVPQHPLTGTAETLAVPGPPAHPAVAALLDRVRSEFSAASEQILLHGVRRLLDFQGPAYADLYLDRLARVRDRAGGSGADGEPLITECARALALWMSYEDTLRVADLKTRGTRLDRVRREVRAEPGQVVRVVEYLHPRVEEVCDTLPAWLGARILSSAPASRALGWLCRKGRRIRTTSLGGFLLLYGLSCLRPLRRFTLRDRREQGLMETWLQRVTDPDISPALALEIVLCQQLIKGYGNTHARGLKNFLAIMDTLERVRKLPDPPQALRKLREAALADEDGLSLGACLDEVA